MNEDIRTAEIRVIDTGGEQLGVMRPEEALAIARSRGIDLVEIVPNAKPPVCKLIEYGKYRFEQQKKEKLVKKHQHVVQIKEVRFHPHTDTHDFEFKVRHAREFLEQGHKVKATVVFRGRQIMHKEFGDDLMKQFLERVADVGKPDQRTTMEGKTMLVIVTPTKAKAVKPAAKKEEA